MSNHSPHSPILPCKWVQQPKVHEKWLGYSNGIWCPGFVGWYFFQRSKKPTKKNTRSSLPSTILDLLVQLLLSCLATDVCLWLQFEFGELICCLVFRLFSACRRLLKVITDHLPKVGKLWAVSKTGKMKQLLDWLNVTGVAALSEVRAKKASSIEITPLACFCLPP